MTDELPDLAPKQHTPKDCRQGKHQWRDHAEGRMCEMCGWYEEADEEPLPTLNPFELGFVKAILEGKTGSDAYRTAYNCEKMSDEAIWVEASRVKARPSVSLWLSRARQQALIEISYGYQDHMADLETAIEQCKSNGAWGAYAKLMELKGRASGVYVERIQTDASEQDIVKLLKSLGQPGRELAASLGVELPDDATKLPANTTTH